MEIWRMNMKNSLIITFVLVIILAFMSGLTGFSLAQPGAAEPIEKDKLVGVFVTTEYLDLFDFEGYLNDNIGKMTDNTGTMPTGGEINMNGDGAEYQGRLYATLKDRSFKSDDTGETVTSQEYVFEGVEGTSYFCYTISGKNGTYSSVSGGEALSDGHTNVSTTDNGEDISLDATIYVVPTVSHATYYMNPVYQSADGRVYAISGGGISFSGDGSEGAAFSRTLDATTTVTENGEAKTYKISAKISFSVVYPPKRISVLQFDSDGGILSREAYLPGALPETITPEKGCSYIVLESYKMSPEQVEKVTRTLYQADDNTLESFHCREDGICIKQYTALNWMQ
jgi:hypothetical protein